jgi:hypothetical protein
MIDERIEAAAILGELIPELEYAAPVLLERLDRGQPLVERKSPSDLGFDTGTIDPQLLELFRTLAPLVTAALSSGVLVILQKKAQAEWHAALTQFQTENVKLRNSVSSMASLLSKALKRPVTEAEVNEAMNDAIQRMAESRR